VCAHACACILDRGAECVHMNAHVCWTEGQSVCTCMCMHAGQRGRVYAHGCACGTVSTYLCACERVYTYVCVRMLGVRVCLAVPQ